MKVVRPGKDPRLVVTTGDIRGIGPEVIAKALSFPEVRQWAEYFVVGPGIAFSGRMIGKIVRGFSLMPAGIDEKFTEGKPEIVVSRVVGDEGMGAVTRPDIDDVSAETAGRWAGESIEVAVKMIESGVADALVTAPIDKGAFISGGYPFAGHTEFLKSLTQSAHVTMFLVGGLLRISLVTTHISLAEVKERLHADDVRGTIRRTAAALRDYFHVSTPRIAVCGLNPHLGEEKAADAASPGTGNKKHGGEERNVIKPVIDELRRFDLHVSGPFSADTIFSRALAGEFDAVVAMYHDQGLGPFKLHAFEKGVNLTLGLPFIRTSPDHGTAMDISGRGIADERSMIHAIRMAREIGVRGLRKA